MSAGDLIQSAEAANGSGDLVVTLPGAPTAGNLLVAWAWSHGDPAAPPVSLSTPVGFTDAPQGVGTIPHVGVTAGAWGSLALYYRTVEPGDATTVTMLSLGNDVAMLVGEFEGPLTVPPDSDSHSHGAHNTTAPWDIDAPLGSIVVASRALIIGSAGWSSNSFADYEIDRGTILTSGLVGGLDHSPQHLASYEFVSSPDTVAPTATETAVVENGGTLGYLLAFTAPVIVTPGMWADFNRDGFND